MSRDEILKTLRERFPGMNLSADGEHPEGLWVTAPDLLEIAAFLKTAPSLAFNYLFFLTAVDRTDSLDMLYHFFSISHNHHAVLKIRLPRKSPSIPTLVPLYPGAEWHEREVFDLFGVTFEGHPDLRRILLPEEWEGHPMLKDYTHPNLVRRPD